MFIIFDKNSNKVISQVTEKPTNVLEGQEIAICNNIPCYNETLGDYLIVTNLQEKIDSYTSEEVKRNEIQIDGQTLEASKLVEVKKERKYFTCDLVVNESPNKAELIERQYENKVSALIRKKYSLNAELAILRQRDTKPEEYQAYNDYAEQCKALVKQEMQGELKWLKK